MSSIQPDHDDGRVSLSERVHASIQHALPHHLLSALMHRATRVRLPLWKNWQIGWFVRRYGVDLGEAEDRRPVAYPHFNAFFTRRLRPETRPLGSEAGAVSSPADGVLSEFGTVRNGTLIQAKGRSYSTAALLGGRGELAEAFENGVFATVYLSPRDYHRVHMPVDGRLRGMIHVPGRLYSVSLATVRLVDGLFARNERVISVFDTEHGLLAVALIGAVFVGSIEQVWSGVVTPRRTRRPTEVRYSDTGEALHLPRGAEMGRFNMGSTVVLLLANENVRWTEGLEPGRAVRQGETIAIAA